MALIVRLIAVPASSVSHSAEAARAGILASPSISGHFSVAYVRWRLKDSTLSGERSINRCFLLTRWCLLLFTFVQPRLGKGLASILELLFVQAAASLDAAQDFRELTEVSSPSQHLWG